MPCKKDYLLLGRGNLNVISYVISVRRTKYLRRSETRLFLLPPLPPFFILFPVFDEGENVTLRGRQC